MKMTIGNGELGTTPKDQRKEQTYWKSEENHPNNETTENSSNTEQGADVFRTRVTQSPVYTISCYRHAKRKKM